MENLENKRKKIIDLFSQYTREDTMIAFSGGVDSSLLLKLACEQATKNGTKVYAYTIHTMLHPMEELEITEIITKEMGAIHRVIQVDELAEAGIENNPENRCYLCKKCMFGKLKEEAKAQGISRIIEGTNLDDTKEYRPGIAALKELGITSPLLLAEFTKADVRSLAKKLGISVSNRPSSPCMATRFPYNKLLDREQLKKVEKIEQHIKNLGFYNVRARIHDSLVRIEVDEREIEKLVNEKKNLICFIKQLGFYYISIDLEGFRSGSQDIKMNRE